jgi:hypothetical protein
MLTNFEGFRRRLIQENRESTGRPGQGASAQDMHMKVRHCFTGIRTIINNEPISFFIKSELARHMGRF